MFIHVKDYHKDVSVKCTFRGCGQYFLSRDLLDVHFEAKHADQEKAKVFKCSHCQFKSIYKAGLQIHVHKRHGGANLYCNYCKILTTSATALKKHLEKCQKMKVCPHCGKSILRSARQHGLSDFCYKCGDKFPCIGLLWKHRKLCTFECDLCHKRFSEKGRLKWHFLFNHKPGAELVWKGLKYESRGNKCDQCRRFCSSQRTLELHQRRMHVPRKKVTCDLCGKQLSDRMIIERHLIAVHGCGDNSIVCFKCGKTFALKSHLKRHVQNVHLDKLVECEMCGILIKHINEHRLRCPNVIAETF